ncbi:hypothetical protein HPP92_018799 [Vanilla planifolia]|uniref:Uncharacterized protein n=1 Tax=Vanilla planifolia TaxID=51239 RepID=A0A835PZF7_VANPL|nr:hypothetical protein HPP92_019364 [Vanilla planifolia]KAG0464635.1 hypothetical protein HPP92_018799 [Vanilla planifolia]
MGEDKEYSSSRHRRYGSQPISVPFLWEHKPGIRKREWATKPLPLPAETTALPLNLVISVPFHWEEKPGKPLIIYENPFIGKEEEEKGSFGTYHFDLHSHTSTPGEADSITVSKLEAQSNPNGRRNGVIDDLFLEFLFPKPVPDAGFTGTVAGHRSVDPLVKRTLTLGELILLSRRLSCRRKQACVKNHRVFSQLQEFIPKSLFSCLHASPTPQ